MGPSRKLKNHSSAIKIHKYMGACVVVSVQIIHHR